MGALTIEELINKIDDIRQSNQSIKWREIVDVLYPGLSGGKQNRALSAIYNIYKNGYRPKSAKMLQFLGLVAYSPAPVCHECGVHHLKGCPHNPKYPRSERYPKLEIHKYEPEKAARSILDNIPDSKIEELIAHLQKGLSENIPYVWLTKDNVSRETEFIITRPAP